MPDLSQTFIDALHRLEGERDIETIAGLFAADAEIANPLVQYEDGGADAARTFWGQYRDAFEEIRSEFRTVKDAGGVSFLEWTSRGSIDGQAFSYEGVSVLETEGDKITAFRTYFDTRHIPTAHSKGGENSGRVQASGQAGASQGGGSQGNGSQGDGAQGNGSQGGGAQAVHAPQDGEAGGEAASKDQMVEAQRDAAEQRSAGGYQ